MHSTQKRLEKTRKLEILDPVESSKLSVKDLVEGSFLELNGETFIVESLSRYLEVKWNSFAIKKDQYVITELEIFSLVSGKTKYLEWEEDDELEVSLTTAVVKLKDITVSGLKLTTDLLEEIEDEEEGKVTVNGISFEYSDEDSWAGRFSKSGDLEKGAPMRAYEFESSDGRYLTVETWHEDCDEKPDREAFLSESVNPGLIKVLAV